MADPNTDPLSDAKPAAPAAKPVVAQAAAPTAAPTAAKEPSIKQLADPSRIKTREFADNVFSVDVEPGTTIEDVETPLFWAHYSAKFKPYDQIVVRTDDGVWYANLLVLSCGRNYAKTFRLGYWQLTTGDVDLSQAEGFDGFTIKFLGTTRKFAIIRKYDKAVIHDGYPSQQAACSGLAEHLGKPSK